MVPIAPSPFETDHENAGSADRGSPNWSYAEAVNGSCPPGASETVAGLIRIVVRVGSTVTVTLLVATDSSGSLTVTWKE